MWPRRALRVSPSVVAQTPISALVPRRTRVPRTAAVMPDSLVMETTSGGFATFFNVYQNLIVGRILLSW